MTHTDRQRPREMVARAIDPLVWGRDGDYPAERARIEARRETSLQQAESAIKALRDLGYFRHDELALIKQEEGAE